MQVIINLTKEEVQNIVMDAVTGRHNLYNPLYTRTVVMNALENGEISTVVMVVPTEVKADAAQSDLEENAEEE